MRRAHLLRRRPRQPAQRTESTPRRLPSGAASQLDPSHRSSRFLRQAARRRGGSDGIGGRGDWFEKQTLGSLPERAARRWGSREALCFKGRRLTFADLAAGVDRAAKGLIALGIRPGDKVALWLLNRPEWIEAAFAVMKIGAVLVPINTRLRTEDVAYITDQSDSTALILAERSGPIDYLAMVRELVPPGVAPAATRLPKLRHIVLFGDEPRPDTVAWSAVLAGGGAVDDAALAARADAVDPEDLAFLMYTSGTTGFPKGAMHCHRMIRNVTDRAFRLAITERDVIMMYLPLFHLFALLGGACSPRW